MIRALLWAAAVSILSRPQTWYILALVSARIYYGAQLAYSSTKKAELLRQQNNDEPLPSAEHVLDAVRYFLRKKL